MEGRWSPDSEMKPLTSPPIVEALIDLQFSSDIEAQDARLWLERISGGSGIVRDLQEHRLNINSDGPSANTISIGASLQEFGEPNATIQLRQSSLTLNQLGPYPGWELFERWARAAIQDLSPAFENRAVSRIAVRFINRINIEDLASKISRYIRAFPQNHFGQDAQVHGFVTKLNVGWPPYYGNIVMATPQGSLSEIVIDIEVFRQVSTHGIQEMLEEWDVLMPELRTLKNKAFEGVISQELIDEFN